MRLIKRKPVADKANRLTNGFGLAAESHREHSRDRRRFQERERARRGADFPKPNTERRNAFVESLTAEIVREIIPVAGSLGESYLAEVLKIDVSKIGDVLERTDAIGWHPEVYFNEPGHPLHGQRLGAIIGVMTDAETELPTGAISMTYIGPDGRKVDGAKTLGSPAGIIRLTPDRDVLAGLWISEGLETALTGMSIGLRPMWSTGSTALMAQFPVLPPIEALNIFCDDDANGAGEKAAREAEARWRAAGREVNVYQTGEPGDLNTLSGGC